MTGVRMCPYLDEAARMAEAQERARHLDEVLPSEHFGPTEVHEVLINGEVPPGFEQVTCVGCGQQAALPIGTFPAGAVAFCRDCASKM